MSGSLSTVQCTVSLRGLAFSEWIADNSGLWSNYCGDIVNTMDLTYTPELNSISCKIAPYFSKYIVRKS